MPSTSTPPTQSNTNLVAERATSLLNAGISRSCLRRNLQDRVFRAQSDVPCPALAESATPSPVNCESSPSAHDHTDSDMQESAQADMAVEALPKGCVMGMPVAQGRPVSRVPNLPVTLDLAIMRSIQADNYKFIRHMIMAGWTPANPTACGFSITINRQGEQEVWHVRQATPLHYAVCCGSLQAAAALLIAFPELAFLSCKVETTSSRMPRESQWTTLDLTSFFGNLYVSLDQERHAAYQQASLVLLRMKQHPQRLPFLQHHTARDRLAQAGKEWSEVTAALFAVTEAE